VSRYKRNVDCRVDADDKRGLKKKKKMAKKCIAKKQILSP
jgi:hypothetical protein